MEGEVGRIAWMSPLAFLGCVLSVWGGARSHPECMCDGEGLKIWCCSDGERQVGESWTHVGSEEEDEGSNLLAPRLLGMGMIMKADGKQSVACILLLSSSADPMGRG